MIEKLFYKTTGIIFVLSGLFRLIYGNVEYQSTLFEKILGVFVMVAGIVGLLLKTAELTDPKVMYKKMFVNLAGAATLVYLYFSGFLTNYLINMSHATLLSNFAYFVFISYITILLPVLNTIILLIQTHAYFFQKSHSKRI